MNSEDRSQSCLRHIDVTGTASSPAHPGVGNPQGDDDGRLHDWMLVDKTDADAEVPDAVYAHGGRDSDGPANVRRRSGTMGRPSSVPDVGDGSERGDAHRRRPASGP